MVRRAILDHGETLAPEDQALPPSDMPADPFRQRGRPWPGAGGRWLVWAGRAIAWAVVLVVGYRGVLAIVTGEGTKTAAAPASSAASSDGFPVSIAGAYALQFGSAYLNFSPADAAARAQELSRFLSRGSDHQLGWDGEGTQRMLSEQVAGVTVTSPHTAVVTLLASLAGGREIELGVPVYAAGGGLSISGAPSLLATPAKAVPPASSGPSDQATALALQRQLPAFFQAYASGDRTTLARFTAPGAHIQSLGGAVAFDGIDAVFAPAGGTTRSVMVTVTWQFAALGGTSAVGSAPATLEMAYQLTVIREGTSWDVAAIGALTQPQAPGPP
jgi:hypothetical protein